MELRKSEYEPQNSEQMECNTKDDTFSILMIHFMWSYVILWSFEWCFIAPHHCIRRTNSLHFAWNFPMHTGKVRGTSVNVPIAFSIINCKRTYTLVYSSRRLGETSTLTKEKNTIVCCMNYENVPDAIETYCCLLLSLRRCDMNCEQAFKTKTCLLHLNQTRNVFSSSPLSLSHLWLFVSIPPLTKS